MTKFIVSMISILSSFVVSSQTFSQHHFKFNGSCILENVISSVDDQGNSVSAYQCVNQSPSVATAYRINVITFQKPVIDMEGYFRGVKNEYSKLGVTTSTTLKDKRAVQVIEDIYVQGQAMKQISVSTFYKNKAITLVLITNSSSYSTILSKFKNQFSFL